MAPPLSSEERDVAGNAIASPEFWSASRACALEGWLECLRNRVAIVCAVLHRFAYWLPNDVSFTLFVRQMTLSSPPLCYYQEIILAFDDFIDDEEKHLQTQAIGYSIKAVWRNLMKAT